MKKLFCIYAVLVSVLPWSSFAQSNLPVDFSFYQRLAEYHAPVIFQEVGHDAEAEAITRFDFDGDLVANNNWENMKFFTTPAFVYFDVKETTTHYFLMYAFFHPRDYSWFCIPWICHENDLEAVTLTVLKDGSTYGKVAVVQTLAHDNVYTYSDLSFETAHEGFHKVSVFIEKWGHGVYLWNPVQGKKAKEGGPAPVLSHKRLMELAQSKYDKNWLIYVYGGISEDTGGLDEGVFQYDFLPIKEEFWDRRHMIGRGQVYMKTFDHKGSRFSWGQLPAAFAGEKWGKGRARPPWAWKNKRENEDLRGDWFFDPALSVSRTLNQPDRFSLDYIYNPYIPENENGLTLRQPASEIRDY